MTGVSYEQMKIVLIAEIAKWANRIDKDGNPCFVLKDIVQIGSDKIWISMDESPGEEGKSWFAKLRTAPSPKAPKMMYNPKQWTDSTPII